MVLRTEIVASDGKQRGVWRPRLLVGGPVLLRNPSCQTDHPDIPRVYREGYVRRVQREVCASARVVAKADLTSSNVCCSLVSWRLPHSTDDGGTLFGSTNNTFGAILLAHNVCCTPILLVTGSSTWEAALACVSAIISLRQKPRMPFSMVRQISFAYDFYRSDYLFYRIHLSSGCVTPIQPSYTLA